MKNFEKINSNLYRGAAPTPKEILWMKTNLGVNKVISLDQESGESIERTCKILGIKQEKCYLDFSRASLIKFLSKDLKQLLNGIVFVHCKHGKDRTGFFIALVKSKLMGESPEKALKDAERFGFGVGVDPEVISNFEKVIKTNTKDVNNADIVQEVREPKGDNRDSVLDQANQGSWAPQILETKQFPIDPIYNFYDDQYDREKRLNPPKSIIPHNNKKIDIPQNGIFNNDAGLSGAGPTVNMTGILYD